MLAGGLYQRMPAREHCRTLSHVCFYLTKTDDIKLVILTNNYATQTLCTYTSFSIDTTLYVCMTLCLSLPLSKVSNMHPVLFSDVH